MSEPLDLDFPFTGRWLVRNSPADRVPSHGTRLFASSRAIDFVPLDGGRTAPITIRSLFRPEPPERFPGFGRPILAPIEGTVVAALGSAPDHAAYRGLPSIGYALTQRRRLEAGWPALAGNHVFIECEGIVVALCHLQHRSVEVHPGRRVRRGDRIGRCGNSGNSTEPHVHVQAFDSADPEHAEAIAVRFRGSPPENGESVDAGGPRSAG